jgi:endonuclease/exonuclease/phosphatase family metal-dependent hydrolase
MITRITTFNCENLFGRYRFLDKASATDAAARKADYTNFIQVYEVVALAPGRKGSIKAKAVSDRQRVNTGAAILGAAPDILCVCEVENLATLRVFNTKYLKDYFDRLVSITGNDARGINVGLLIKRGSPIAIEAVRTHADEADAGDFVFSSNRLNTKVVGAATYSRDALEVDLQAGATPLTLLVNHLKAQDIDSKTKSDRSTKRRLAQATHVAALVAQVKQRQRYPVVLGDFNKDTAQADYDGSLDPLVKHPSLYDPFPAMVPAVDLWSHYYSGDRKVSRLDYILVDASLKNRVSGAEFFREGLTPKCRQYQGKRLKTLTKDGEEASDHCPTTLVVNL